MLLPPRRADISSRALARSFSDRPSCAISRFSSATFASRLARTVASATREKVVADWYAAPTWSDGSGAIAKRGRAACRAASSLRYVGGVADASAPYSGSAAAIARRLGEAGRDCVDISFMPESALPLDSLARERGVTAVTDCGAGGLSSAVGEMAAKLGLLGFGRVDQGLLFAGNVGAFHVGLRADRDIFPCRHGHCARHQPGHPLADAEGYVYMSNVNVVDEMVNMISASRSYQNSIEVLNTSKDLLLRTLTLGQ